MGARQPGTTCAARGDIVDEATNCCALTPQPGTVGAWGTGIALDPALLQRGFDGIRRTAGDVIDWTVDVADSARKEAAYAFFASWFDHYLPKKFLRQHVWGGGRGIELSEQEMIDCNPRIDLRRCKDILLPLATVTASGKPADFWVEGSCGPFHALTNGSLGQFTVKFSGLVTCRSRDDWDIAGTMTFDDTWNFDLKKLSVSGRSLQGDLKTTFAHYTLPGTGFPITSVKADFKQSTRDSLIVWKGGRPVGVPDRFSKGDAAVANE